MKIRTVCQFCRDECRVTFRCLAGSENFQVSGLLSCINYWDSLSWVCPIRKSIPWCLSREEDATLGHALFRHGCSCWDHIREMLIAGVLLLSLCHQNQWNLSDHSTCSSHVGLSTCGIPIILCVITRMRKCQWCTRVGKPVTLLVHASFTSPGP